MRSASPSKEAHLSPTSFWIPWGGACWALTKSAPHWVCVYVREVGVWGCEWGKEDIPLIPYVTFMPMAADIIPHKHSVGDNMAALIPIIVIITVTQFTIHNQLPPITILWVMWFSNECYYIITNDVRMMFWRTYLLIQDTCPVIIHLDRELWWNTLHHSHKFVCPHTISTVNLNTCSWERRWLRVVGREKGRRRERGGEVEERGRKRDGRRFYHSKLSQAFLLQELRDWLWGSQNCWFCTCYDEVIWNEFLTCKIYNPFHLPFVPAYGKQLLVCGSSPPLWECQMLCLCWCNAPCSAAGEW